MRGRVAQEIATARRQDAIHFDRVSVSIAILILPFARVDQIGIDQAVMVNEVSRCFRLAMNAQVVR